MTAPKLTGNRCQCTACGECFNGTQPFDKHRVGEYGVNRRCLTVAEMAVARFMRNAVGFLCARATAEHATRRCAPGKETRFGYRAIPTQPPTTRAPDLQPPACAA